MARKKKEKVSIPENGVIPFEDKSLLLTREREFRVSIPENGVIPFEVLQPFCLADICLIVSIPENGVIPFEDVIKKITSWCSWLCFNPREWG